MVGVSVVRGRAPGGAEAFDWYLRTYHTQFFVLLGGHFLEPEGRTAADAQEVALGRRLRAALSGCERDEAHLDGAWARPDALTDATLPRAVSRRASYVDTTTPVL